MLEEVPIISSISTEKLPQVTSITPTEPVLAYAYDFIPESDTKRQLYAENNVVLTVGTLYPVEELIFLTDADSLEKRPGFVVQVNGSQWVVSDQSFGLLDANFS